MTTHPTSDQPGFRRKMTSISSLRTGLLLLLLAVGLPSLQTGCSTYAKVTEKHPGFHPIHNTVGSLASAPGQIANALSLTKTSPEKAIGEFLETAAAAEQQLLKNPRDKGARDTYNFALARVFGTIRDAKMDPWGQPLTIPSAGGDFILTHRPPTRRMWHPSLYELTPADQFDMKGTYVTKHEIKEGVGAPLVAVGREDNKNARADYANARTYYGITAVARFKGRRCEIDFKDPLATETVDLDGKTFPLAADFTVPMAVMLAATNPKKIELARLLNPGKYTDTAHIARLQPYDPNKTVVLVVHGLMDSPATWTPMLNELRGHPEIRKNYQFWFFSYPSGYPFPYSASILRNELDGIEKRFKLQKKIVVIGHSMGGCISRLMITDSGMTLWNKFFPKPPEKTAMSDKSKKFFTDSLIFNHRAEIGRVIFISAPLRGADMAGGWIGKLGARLVRAPSSLLNVGQEGLKFVSVKNSVSPTKRLPNSVDTLSPNNNFVKALTTLPLAPGIPYHSIMGDRGKGGNKDHTKPMNSDGLVPYWSSHLDGAVSELEVPSGHSAHQNPQAIAEVLRILKENAGK
ncbi:MAG: alpha/beta hydrolase [Verrucomicrobiota bacterium]